MVIGRVEWGSDQGGDGWVSVMGVADAMEGSGGGGGGHWESGVGVGGGWESLLEWLGVVVAQ